MHIPSRLSELAERARHAKNWEREAVLQEIAEELERIVLVLEKSGIGHLPPKK